MRALMVALLVVVAMLQYKVWFSDVGHVAAERLQAQLDEQNHRADELAERNRRLMAEVLALKIKDDYAAVESRARRDLGMIRQGETFYLVPDHR
jgi:cell division protein FtsB